jgi:hypothetical protein
MTRIAVEYGYSVRKDAKASYGMISNIDPKVALGSPVVVP